MAPYEPWVVVLCGYHRRDSWPIFLNLKKGQVRRRTAGCQERWTPETARRVDKSSVVMGRTESGSVVQCGVSGSVGSGAGNVRWSQRKSYTKGKRDHGTDVGSASER
ncbi:hypothetical protein E2C01_040883 [Portunus trituberculatus]|uniref:Uncharacterized protein n=1 Tax=Portunus trituberculatus TaxID=210409 RepID=A0A5B7FP70_PORTR|nr:hypothetical protein [Portunus trituberculatus]